MKIPKLFKKAAAFVMAAVTALSIMPATAFAAGDIGTISFSHTYDSNGNAMRYNSSANIGGYTAGGTGNYKYRIQIRDCVRKLIEYQTEDYPEEMIRTEQENLNRLYDVYTAKYGLINSRGNYLAFASDESYFLLCSLEVLDDEGNFKRKADMFTKRTIKPNREITSVETASEALALSIGEKARVDLPYMEQLTGKTQAELVQDLQGVIFKVPNCEPVSYVAADEYPIGFYKNVKLNDTDQEKMADIISTLSGVSVDDLLGKDDEVSEAKGDIEVTLSDDISYEEFKACMKQADDLIGGGSNYSENNLLNYSYVAVTYEEAIENYNLIASKDKFTGAYARLFCDYVGIILSIFPVFIAVAVCLKDRRAKMNELIYARKTSSFNLILTRYFSVIIAVMLPTIILAYISNSSVWGQYSGMSLDYLAPLKYTIGWLMPSVMISAAIGMFFTELTETPIAIAIQGLWWFIDINIGVSKLRGVHTLFELAPRHNVLGNTQTFLDEFNTLAANRLIMVGAALLLVIATVIIYEQKRRGELSGYKKIKTHIASLANRKSKSAA